MRNGTIVTLADSDSRQGLLMMLLPDHSSIYFLELLGAEILLSIHSTKVSHPQVNRLVA